jgi:putative ABC transport system permease protein
MSFLMIVRIAVKALNRNKMRTALTMLGMIIGVAAVITMVALGSGAQTSIEAQIQSAGTNMIIVSAGNFSQGGVRQGQGNASTLTPDDAAAIARLTACSTPRPGPTPRADRRRQSELEYPGAGHGRGPAADPVVAGAEGGFFTPQDVTTAAKVACSERRSRSALPARRRCGRPDHQDSHQPFTVVGVMASKGQSWNGPGSGRHYLRALFDGDEEASGHHIHSAGHGLAASAGETSAVADSIATLLRTRHKIQPGDPDDFMVRTMEEMASVRRKRRRR